MNISLDTRTYYGLPDNSIAKVSGEDARAFLQGQLSNDINQLNDEKPHQLSAYCNPKGRMLAIFHVIKFGHNYFLIAPSAVMDKVFPRLKMFVMRSAVDIVSTDEFELVGLFAPDITDIELSKLLTADTQIANHACDPNRYFLLRDGHTDYELELELELKPEKEWRRMDIKQNLPQVYIETYEQLIPQSVNLDIVGGVNFKKGCFPGQEIIARVKYRGKPKTRMIGVILGKDVPVEVGAAVYIDQRDRSAGEVINLVQAGDRILLSISIPVTHISDGALYLDEAKTVSLERMISPYEITI